MPTPMGGFLPQCVSLESRGGAGPVLTAIPRGLRAPGPGSRAPWAVFTAIPTRRIPLSQRCLRFHSATTLCKRYNALGFSQEVQRAVCVGFLRGFPAKAFAGSLVELIVHLLDPRGVDAVQWGPLGEVLAQQAVGVLIGAALPGAAGLAEVDGGAQWFLKGGAGGELVAPVHGEGAAVWGARACSMTNETSTARLEGALPPTRYPVARPRRGD